MNVQSFFHWAVKRGLTTDEAVLGHIHAGLRSAPQTKTWQRWYHQEAARLFAQREAARAAYEAAVAAGEVIRPPKPTLERIALGHPDNPSVQAAQRAIARRAEARARCQPSGDSGQLAISSGLAP